MEPEIHRHHLAQEIVDVAHLIAGVVGEQDQPTRAEASKEFAKGDGNVCGFEVDDGGLWSSSSKNRAAYASATAS
jgi:hypothetical protein